MDTPPTHRILSIDAVRGLAILGMALSGTLPWGTLPAWMYHAQIPPPDMKFNPEVPGITWVDWVFPLFLFALGAAIPLARAAKPDPGGWRVTGEALKRGALLLAFAYLSQHLRPFSFDPSPTARTWWLGLLFFVATVMAYLRWPKDWPRWVGSTGQTIGWAILVAGLIWLPPGEGKSIYFSVDRVDIILFVLANVAVSGTVAWYFTRTSPLNRIAIMAFVAAVFLTATLPGPGKWIWDFTPAKWAYQFNFHKYLLLVLPGTFCGEFLLRDREQPQTSLPFAIGLTSIGLALAVLITVLLFERHVDRAFWTAVGLGGGATWAAYRWPGVSEGRRQLALWGTVMLALGILLDPLAGGIKKDPSHLTYWITLAGGSFWLVLAFAYLIDSARSARGWVWLTAVGANPLLGYVAITNFTPSVIRITGLHGWVGGQGFTPWQMAAYAGFQTALVALVCWLATRYRLFLRA